MSDPPNPRSLQSEHAAPASNQAGARFQEQVA
jgi:hypothetical protein